MTALDWWVIALYGVGMLSIGAYYWRYSRSREDYLLGGRRMNPLLLGLSLFAALTSTLSYLAMPGEMIGHGPMIFSQTLAYPVVGWLVGWWLIPAIMALPATSAYEILEVRLGIVPRLVGAALFLALRLAWMAAILYATTDAVLVPLLGIDPAAKLWVCAALGLVTVMYASLGGLRAVVVTDAAQCLIMIAGAAATVGVVSMELGGIRAWWPTEWVRHWDPFSLGFAATGRTSVLAAIVSGLVWYVCTAGSDQIAIQRYLAARDVRAARRGLITSLFTDLLVTALLATAGLAVFGYFQMHPERMQPGTRLPENADQLFPQFIVVGLPAGASGLVIAAILSAAMSSISAGINSACAVVSEDYIGRLRRRRAAAANSDDAERNASGESAQRDRWLSVAIGVIVVLLSLAVSQVPGNLLELCYKVSNLLTVPLAVLYFTAIFMRRATSVGALAGVAAAIAVAVSIGHFQVFGLSFLLMMPLSLLCGLSISFLASRVPLNARDRS